MSAANGTTPDYDNTPERAEYEAATKGLRYAKEFHAVLEALMMDTAATYGQRFLAWLKRRSHGNFRLFAVNDDGSDAIQADCSRDLGIDKRIISNLVNYYEKRGYLYRIGKRLYPTISPKVSPLPEKVTPASDFLEYIEWWKVAHSSDFLELEVARATVERIRKVQIAGYEPWKASRTNGAHINNVGEIESREETESSSSSLPLPSEPEKATTTTVLSSETPKPEPATTVEVPASGLGTGDNKEGERTQEQVTVLTEVLTEALQSHPIGGMPSHEQIKQLVPLLPNGGNAEVIRAFGAWLKTEKLATRKLKSVGGLQAFTKEFARVYVHAPPKKAPTARWPHCPKCKSLSSIDGKCRRCGIPESQWVT